ncbi:MAG: hypothetical protein M9963_06160 [Kiritimatiellae bacterium]|nr:hypothetical protein [Kiritimatiellia bacterium]MCO5067356.1 hypothetical protein [Kiritimatiellia bacterium]
MNESETTTQIASAPCSRNLRIFTFLALLICIGFPLAALLVGLRAPQAMIGDEVTHYYLLAHQSEVFPEVTFEVPIATGWGEPEVRNYAHSNLWHYLGAALFRLLPSFATIQIYHALFFLQLLLAGFLLIRRRLKSDAFAALLYLLVLASLPMSLIFSVAFYQDVPMTAQILTAFCLLDRRRWVWGTIFLALAFEMKETAVLFIPGFLAMLAAQRWGDARGLARAARWKHLLIPLALSAILLWLPMQVTDRMLEPYGGFYPFRQIEAVAERAAEIAAPPKHVPTKKKPASPAKKKKQSISIYENSISAYHPGDLREPKNWAIYGGGVLWVVVLGGAAAWALRRTRLVGARTEASSPWPFWVAVSFLGPAIFLLKTSPDARFFFPALPLLLIPLVEAAARIVRPRIWVSALALLALVQTGLVLHKMLELREVSPSLREAIAFLKEHPPAPPRVFMYPEGSYRLFPVPHDWYLGDHLREFWLRDNEYRLQLLAQRKIGAIVLKKYRVAAADARVSNLGIYPDFFAEQLDADARFRRVFDNDAIAIYEWDAPALMPPE